MVVITMYLWWSISVHSTKCKQLTISPEQQTSSMNSKTPLVDKGDLEWLNICIYSNDLDCYIYSIHLWWVKVRIQVRDLTATKCPPCMADHLVSGLLTNLASPFHPVNTWGLGPGVCFTNVLRAPPKIISRKYTMPETTYMMRISSWNFVRVPKVWLWALVQIFSLKFL